MDYKIVKVQRIVDSSGVPIPECALKVFFDDTVINVPTSENNLDYQYVLKWISEGNQIEDYYPSNPSIELLTPQQKLEAAGLSIEELKELLGLDT